MKVINFLVLNLIWLGFYCSSVQASTESQPVKPEFVYDTQPAPNVLIPEKRQQAINSEKLLMVVYGAQWCHDSTGLAETFSDPEFYPKLLQQYAVAFVDVGFLEKGFESIKQFELPIFYGTPTVLIVEPNSMQVLNKPDLMYWTNAASYSLDEFKTYFLESDFKAAILSKDSIAEYREVIQTFELKQSERLRDAYKVVGPLLHAYKEDSKGNHQEFYEKWKEVRAFRTKVPADVIKLEQEAKDNIAQGIHSPLTLPSYGKFSWE
jgi:hypothetical protein